MGLVVRAQESKKKDERQLNDFHLAVWDETSCTLAPPSLANCTQKEILLGLRGPEEGGARPREYRRCRKREHVNREER